MNKPIAELLATQLEGDDVGAEPRLGGGVEPPFADHPIV